MKSIVVLIRRQLLTHNLRNALVLIATDRICLPSSKHPWRLAPQDPEDGSSSKSYNESPEKHIRSKVFFSCYENVMIEPLKLNQIITTRVISLSPTRTGPVLTAITESFRVSRPPK